MTRTSGVEIFLSVPAPEVEIRQTLLRVGAPSEGEIAELVALGRRELLARGDSLAREGDTLFRVAFVHRGIVRYHVRHPGSGKDITKDLGFAGAFAVSYGSALQGEPARVAISAVEDCVVTTWSWADFIGAFGRNMEWESMRRRLAERMFVRKETRELSFLLDDARGRYEAALRSFPPDLERVPQHVLASYLGITPESLSRLKRRA